MSDSRGIVTDTFLCFFFVNFRLIKVSSSTCLWHRESRITVAGPEIPRRGGANPWNWGENLLFVNIFAKYCVKMKEIGPRLGQVSVVPPPPPPRPIHQWIKTKMSCDKSVLTVPSDSWICLSYVEFCSQLDPAYISSFHKKTNGFHIYKSTWWKNRRTSKWKRM